MTACCEIGTGIPARRRRVLQAVLWVNRRAVRHLGGRRDPGAGR